MTYEEAAYRLDQLVQNPDIEASIHRMTVGEKYWYITIVGKKKENFATLYEVKATGRAPTLLEAIDQGLAHWHTITAGVPEMRAPVLEYHPTIEPDRAGPPTPRRDLDDDIPF